MQNIKRENVSIILWLFSGCFLIFTMVIVGGITRLTGSGLSMVDWNLFMGVVPPLNYQEWMEAFNQYKEYPEYQERNYMFSLTDFKKIFFWEYIHRVLGRFIGLVFIIPYLYFIIRKRFTKKLLFQTSVLLILGSLQGFFGWWMVKSGLVDRPDVSHLRLATHLITAFLTFSFTFCAKWTCSYHLPLTDIVWAPPIQLPKQYKTQSWLYCCQKMFRALQSRISCF